MPLSNPFNTLLPKDCQAEKLVIRRASMIKGQRVIPALRMTQYARSKEFYVDKLGFALEWEHRFGPKMPVFCSISREGMQLYLSEHRGDCQVGGLVHFLIESVD